MLCIWKTPIEVQRISGYKLEHHTISRNDYMTGESDFSRNFKNETCSCVKYLMKLILSILQNHGTETTRPSTKRTYSNWPGIPFWSTTIPWWRWCPSRRCQLSSWNGTIQSPQCRTNKTNRTNKTKRTNRTKTTLYLYIYLSLHIGNRDVFTATHHTTDWNEL